MGNYTTDLLTEISKPGCMDVQVQKAIVNNNPLYASIAGEPIALANGKVKYKPKMREESDVGTGYFEGFILLKENGNITWRSRTEALDVDDIDLGDRWKAEIKDIVGTIPLYQRDLDLNDANKDRIVKLVDTAMVQAKDTAVNLLGAGMFALGTGYASKEMYGLRYWLPDAVTSGSVAGIDQATETIWRSGTKNASGDSFATYAEDYIRGQLLGATYGNVSPDIGVMDTTSMTRLKSILKSRQQLGEATNDLTKAGFKAIEFDGVSLIADGNCPAGSLYFPTTSMMELLMVKGCNFRIGKFVEPTTEQYVAAKLVVRLNMIMKQRKQSTKIYNFTTA